MDERTGKKVVSPSHKTRREFMKGTGMALAGVALTAAHSRAFAATKGPELRLGLIGCGSRGSGAAQNALLADWDVKLYALADPFADQMEACLAKFKKSRAKDNVVVTPERCFSGLDGYLKVIECCDVIVMAAPPAFRPAHIEAAVAAGKHVFAEKPVAVDAPGIRSVLESCRKAAEKNLTIVSGLCYRYEFAKQDTLQRIHDGMIGDILTIESVYNTGGLWLKERRPEWSDLEYQLRNWLYYDWLSGDHISEQHIHSLDKTMWVMQDVPPIKATSSGGRVQRTGEEYGNVYDHFNTVFEWENGEKCFSSCRQWVDCSTNVSDIVVGTLGRSSLQEHVINTYAGESWQHERKGSDDMYQNELNAFFEAIRSDNPINNGEYMCSSNMIAIMGRMAAYSGKTVTWDEAFNSELSLMPESLEWGDMPKREPAIPGTTVAF